MQEKTIYFRWSFVDLIFFPFLSRKGRALWAFALKTHAAPAFSAKELP